MKNPRMKKPISTLAERLKAIRRRPLTSDQIDRLNRVFDEMERNDRAASGAKKTERKIAKEVEAEQ